MEQVNELTTAYLAVSFYDKNRVLAVPVSTSYKIDCLTTGAAILPDTVGPIGSSIELTITSAQNALIKRANAQEERVVTITATYANSEKVTDSFRYGVKRLDKLV